MQEQEQHLHGGINDTFALTGDSGVEHDDEEEDEDEEDGEDDDEEEEEEEGEIRGKGGRRVFGNMTGEGLDVRKNQLKIIKFIRCFLQDEGGSSLTTEADSEDIDNGHLLGQDGDEDDEDVLGAYGDEHDDDGGDGGIPDMGSDDDF